MTLLSPLKLVIAGCAAMLLLMVPPAARADAAADASRRDDERLSFQTHADWSPRLALDADVAIGYGIDAGLPARLRSWREHGYRAQVMTGVSWGRYGDYLHGGWDGVDHTDERQTDKDGNPLQHGAGAGDVWYMSPGERYGKYLSEGIRRALDAGTDAVYLEEPEFWVRGGYEPSFRREWKAYYGEEWRPPHESVDNQYRSSKLKYYLYRRALAEIFASVKQYGREHGGGRDVPCYVPTHSLLNYAHWRIVSPESSLLDVGCDGYIAQVWTGTAHTPNVYQGVRRSRTFETAYLEYGAMQNLVRASGRKIWYLNDPIEDNPNYSWSDYRSNWESTLVASLLQPQVWRFEVMPWPERVFTGKYPSTTNPSGDNARPPSTPLPTDRIGIPADYATELQAVIHAMGDLRQPSERVRWQICGTRDIGVLVSDTMMFERGEPNPSDANLGSFYGLAMPLLKRGLPVEPVQIESAATARGFLDHYRVLLLTYEGQKPPSPQFHEALVAWVRAGGALVVIDDDKDPYNAVREWWNTPPLVFQTPRQHLFEALGLASDTRGPAHVSKGVVVYEPLSPAALTYDQGGAQRVRDIVHMAAEAVGVRWSESTALALRRGPYVVAAGLDESVPDAAPIALQGRFIDLFNPKLAVVTEVKLEPGRRVMLLDVDVARAAKPESVIAAACGIREESAAADALRFRTCGISGTRAVVCLATNERPRRIAVGGKPLDQTSWQFENGVLALHFENDAAGMDVEILH